MSPEVSYFCTNHLISLSSGSLSIDAALPDLVVAQTQHLQCPEAQETPWDGLQLVVV